MELDGAQGNLYGTDWNDHPGESSAEKATDHPKGGLDPEIRTTVFVANEFRVVGEEDR